MTIYSAFKFHFLNTSSQSFTLIALYSNFHDNKVVTHDDLQKTRKKTLIEALNVSTEYIWVKWL